MIEPQMLNPGTRITITNDVGETHSGVYSGIEYVHDSFMLVLDAVSSDWSSHNIKFIIHLKRD